MPKSLITPDTLNAAERLRVRDAGEMETVLAEIDGVKAIIKIARQFGGAQEALDREIEILDRLEGTGVAPQVYEVKEKGDSVYAALEHIPGGDFQETLNISEWKMDRLKPYDALNLLGRLGQVEQALLDRGVLYRDLSLSHILMTPDGEVKYIDFDASAIDMNVDARGKKTWDYDDLRGTWETMAPEEFPGRGTLTEATATYRLATLYHLLLAGRLPRHRLRHREDYQNAFNHGDDLLRLSSRLSDEGTAFFAKALAAKPEDRFQSIDELMTAAAGLGKGVVTR